MSNKALLKTDNTRSRAIIMQLTAAILWSFGGPLIKLVDLNSMAISGIRSFITIFIMLMFLKKSAFRLTKEKAIGAIVYAAMILTYVAATKLTTAANAILLQYSSPIYIALFGGWLLKEKAKTKDWITIMFVVSGMLLFFMDDISGGSVFGNLLAIISGVALAFNTMLMRKQKNADPLESVFWGSIVTVIVTLPFMFQSVPSTKSWIGLLLLGVFQLGLSYVLYSKAIKKITALESTFISLIEPLLNPIWVFLAVGELPGRMAIIGGVIVLASVTIGCIKPNKCETPHIASTNRE